jgi:hypothetical protein
MDQLVKNILVLVASIPGENPGRRKGKGFLATLIGQELAGPKTKRNRDVERESR